MEPTGMLAALLILGGLFGLAAWTGDSDNNNGEETNEEPTTTDLTDSSETFRGSNVVDIINGQGGNDTLFGAGGNDQINGGTENDAISGGDGNDDLKGEEGNDLLATGTLNSFEKGGVKLSDEITINDDGFKTYLADAGDGDAGNDVLKGGVGDDIIVDTQGSNVAYGGDGNDVIAVLDSSSGQSDSASGGDGNDTLIGDDGDTLEGGEGTDSFRVVHVEGENAVEIKDWTPGEPINIALPDGASASDLAYSIVNGKVQVSLNGNAVVNVSSADNVAFTTDNIPAVQEAVAGQQQPNGITVELSPSSESYAGTAGNDTISGGEGNDVLLGRDGNDVIKGDSEADAISGGAGNDNIDGGQGADLIASGTASGWTKGSTGIGAGIGSNNVNFESYINNTPDGDAGSDVIRGGTGGDTIVDLEGTNVAYGGSESDYINMLDNTVGQSDSMHGGAGADILVGDDGDIMQGGDDKDQFRIVHVPGEAHVRIVDFEIDNPATTDVNERESIIVYAPSGSGAPTATLSSTGVVTIRIDGNIVASARSFSNDEAITTEAQMNEVLNAVRVINY